jgi:hypothetical protein
MNELKVCLVVYVIAGILFFTYNIVEDIIWYKKYRFIRRGTKNVFHFILINFKTLRYLFWPISMTIDLKDFIDRNKK